MILNDIIMMFIDECKNILEQQKHNQNLPMENITSILKMYEKLQLSSFNHDCMSVGYD